MQKILNVVLYDKATLALKDKKAESEARFSKTPSAMVTINIYTMSTAVLSDEILAISTDTGANKQQSAGAICEIGASTLHLQPIICQS